MGTSLFDRLKMPRRLHSLALDASRETVYTHRLYLKWKVNIEWKLFFEEKKRLLNIRARYNPRRNALEE